MNDESQAKPMEESRKTALLRYLAILFAVAFLLVLISMLAQMRNSQTTISQLTQSSTSAAQNIEQLQENNRSLEDALLAEQTANQDLLESLAEAEAKEAKTRQAYEQLLLVIKLSSQGNWEGNVALSRALDALEEQKQYLDPNGLEVYESLLKEVE